MTSFLTWKGAAVGLIVHIFFPSGNHGLTHRGSSVNTELPHSVWYDSSEISSAAICVLKRHLFIKTQRGFGRNPVHVVYFINAASGCFRCDSCALLFVFLTHVKTNGICTIKWLCVASSCHRVCVCETEDCCVYLWGWPLLPPLGSRACVFPWYFSLYLDRIRSFQQLRFYKNFCVLFPPLFLPPSN